MRQFSLAIGTPILLGITLSLSSASLANPPAHQSAAHKSQSAERKAIEKYLKADLTRTTPDHLKISRYSITHLDIQKDWAFANINPIEKPSMDPFKVLLRKQKGHWKTVTLGTGFYGVGKQYGVPHHLWKKWGIEGS